MDPTKTLLASLALLALIFAGGAASAATTVQRNVVSHVIGDVVIPAGTTIPGDVTVAVGNLQVDGTVTGSVSVGVGNVIVNGTVDGDVHVGIGRIDYGPSGKVGGVAEVGMAPGNGGFHLPPLPVGIPFVGLAFFSPLFAILRWLGTAAIALPVVALFPEAVSAVTSHVAGEPVRAGLLGLAAMILAVPVFILVAITIIGLPVVFLAAVALVLAIFLGYVCVSVWIGEAVLHTLNGPGANHLWAVLVGTFLLALAGFVPILGGLVSLCVAAIGLGAILLWRFRGLRRPSPTAG